MNTCITHSTRVLPPDAVRGMHGAFELKATGRSMEPLIREHDSVTVSCEPVETYALGDVVCFQRQSEWVVHRIVAVDPECAQRYYEKGDAETGGSWVRHDAVVGKVTQVNQRPLTLERKRRALRFHQYEQAIIRVKNHLGCRAVPVLLQKVWRRIKRS